MAATLNDTGAATVAAPVKILLVDDQPGRLLTYRTILEPLGEELVDARSGMEALKLLMEDEYAVILLDVNMPVMDGFETATLIHQHPRFENTPIIFVTAVNLSDLDRLRGYKLGAVDYVMVPVIPEIMRTKVSVLAELYRKRRELQALNASLATAHRELQVEKARELERLNASLRAANAELELRNRELLAENKERTRAERRLREADQRKDEFLATLAHELRNPLAPLQNALAVRRLREPDDHDPLLAMMERQLSLLVRMIEDLLDIARITRGKLTLRRASTILQDVIAAAVDTARPLIEEGGHTLELNLPESPVPLDADHARLAQVFANLLNNAAKYSDAKGRIELGAALEGDEVQVWISDSGIGLTPEQMDTVFEMFHQVDTTVERSRGGLGIGLTLVQRLTEMHGGRVEVQSDGPGLGATFRVRLPHSGTVEAVAPSAAPVRNAANEKRRVLIVDDNHDAADTLAMMVRLLGHDTRAVYDPLTVEGEVSAFGPEIVFLDVGMPGRSGYDVARALRDMHGSALVIVAVTGWGQPEDRQRTTQAGFDHHLVKPPDIQAITDICSKGLRPLAEGSPQ
ncbi:response regulator [Lysobacter auxotrophicus]|uniref:histidine kinase n=1 Tax=Lysobacter auxotrophicus TaxID=2992573 RepID=A0ABN6UQ26_9GAMM|nr:response regulator [Lysobacter auxotrophicus]BDU18441.1 response regulator [Lysobacter auxotrophicus]